MSELAGALPWVSFWAVVGLFLWINHKQYMAGHETEIFRHKTPEELRLREAAVRKAELEAGIKKDPSNAICLADQQ